MSKVDWENAPDWADRVLRTLTGAIIFSDSSYFLSENGEKIKHGSLLEVFPDGHELLSFKYGNCTIIEMRPDEWKKGAERMEPIVQNGNDGEHYADISRQQESRRLELEKAEKEEQAKVAAIEVRRNKLKYHREIKKGVSVDVYDVLSAFEVVNPAMQHALKKMLAPGKRGAKDAIQDMQEAIQSIERAIELEKEQGE